LLKRNLRQAKPRREQDLGTGAQAALKPIAAARLSGRDKGTAVPLWGRKKMGSLSTGPVKGKRASSLHPLNRHFREGLTLLLEGGRGKTLHCT